MKTLIIYQSKHGATAKCAKELSESLQGETVLCNVKEGRAPNAEAYDAIIIGGPVYMGQLPKKLKSWMQANQTVLQNKRCGVFACGMTEGEKTAEVLQNAFPTEILSNAEAIGFFGGAFYLSKMNFFERWVIQKVSKAEGGLQLEHGPEGDFVEKYNKDAILSFAEKMNHESR